jgi:hypothetical protein
VRVAALVLLIAAALIAGLLGAIIVAPGLSEQRGGVSLIQLQRGGTSELTSVSGKSPHASSAFS